MKLNIMPEYVSVCVSTNEKNMPLIKGFFSIPGRPVGMDELKELTAEERAQMGDQIRALLASEGL